MFEMTNDQETDDQTRAKQTAVLNDDELDRVVAGSVLGVRTEEPTSSSTGSGHFWVFSTATDV